MPSVLLESDVRADLDALDRAWADDPTFALLPDRTPVDRQWVAQALDQLPDPLRKRHFALLSSGSTGAPKLILGERQRAESLARLLDRVQESENVRRALVTLPLSYCYAFVNQYLWARVNERELVLTPGFAAPDELAATLENAQSAQLCLVGAQVPLLFQLPGRPVYPGVVRLHFAGGQFPQHALLRLREVFPEALIFNNYGCAEAMPRLSLRPAEDAESAGDIGRPLPGVEFASFEDGSLRFRSPYAAVAFYENDCWTGVGDEDWIETGDLGAEGDDGRWVLSGRTGEVFKRHGEKVSLPQLLSAVHRTWQGEAAMFRETDPNGEHGCVLVLAPRPQEGEHRSILRGFRQGFPRAAWPLRIEGADSIPRLVNGKIDIDALRRLADKTTVWRQRI
jgi:long-chain acyl-CoA synthetase